MQQEAAYLWQVALKRAIAESDPRLAATKIEKAELALFRRIHAFVPGQNALEEQSMFDALKTIRRLKMRWQPQRIPRRRPTLEIRAVSKPIKGCGKDDKPSTLFLIPLNGELSPLRGGYYHVHCGYRPPSKIKNGILLCDSCVERLSLPALSLNELSRISSESGPLSTPPPQRQNV